MYNKDYMLQKADRGFTLIELLLVITIIGLLAAIVLAGLADSRSKARDAKRITDLRTIASALEFYYSDKGRYPVAVGQVTGCGMAGINWIPDGTDYSWSTKYISTVPRDPLESCAAGSQRAYSYEGDGSTYKLTTQLEKSAPPGTPPESLSYNGSFFQPVVDNSPITVSFQTPLSNPTSESPIPLIISFSRGVVDFTQGSISVVRGVVSGFSGVLASLFNIFVTPTDNDTIIVSIIGGTVHDQNGVGNTAAQFTITYDSLHPHVALSPDPLPATVSGGFSVSVNFTVAVVDFSASKVSVSNGTVSNFVQQNGSNYTFMVTPNVRGTITVSIPAGVTNSAAGNGNVESNHLNTSY